MVKWEDDISTHSLTRRLTGYEDNTQDWVCISTHSLTRRLNYDVMPNPPVGLNFNSQPHKEADRN